MNTNQELVNINNRLTVLNHRLKNNLKDSAVYGGTLFTFGLISYSISKYDRNALSSFKISKEMMVVGAAIALGNYFWRNFWDSREISQLNQLMQTKMVEVTTELSEIKNLLKGYVDHSTAEIKDIKNVQNDLEKITEDLKNESSESMSKLKLVIEKLNRIIEQQNIHQKQEKKEDISYIN